MKKKLTALLVITAMVFAVAMPITAENGNSQGGNQNGNNQGCDYDGDAPPVFITPVPLPFPVEPGEY